MAIYSQRNNLKTEYSGVGEISEELRNRLLLVVREYVTTRVSMDYGLSSLYSAVHIGTLDAEIQRVLGENGDDLFFRKIWSKKYSDVFDAIEILAYKAKALDYPHNHNCAITVHNAFENSNSAYLFNIGTLCVELKIDDETANQIRKASEILTGVELASSRFEKAVSSLVSRAETVENIIRDTMVALEDYIKHASVKKKEDDARKWLRMQLHPTQAEVYERLRAYKGDVKGASHAGNTVANEEDAIWFIGTSSSLIKLINDKTKK